MGNQKILTIFSLLLLAVFWLIIEISQYNILLYFLLPILWCGLLLLAILFIKNLITQTKERRVGFRDKELSLGSVLQMVTAICLVVSLLLGSVNFALSLFFDFNIIYNLINKQKEVYCQASAQKPNRNHAFFCCQCLTNFQEENCYKCFTYDSDL